MGGQPPGEVTDGMTRRVKLTALVVTVVVIVVAVVATVTLFGVGRTSSARNHQPVALFVGDSYTHGARDVDAQHTYAPLTCRRLAWTCRLDAVGGSGFVRGRENHQDYLSRLPEAKEKYHPDYVFVTGGRNDLFRPEISQADIIAAVTTYLTKVRAAFPTAKLVVLSPFWIEAPLPSEVQWLTGVEEGATRAVGATWISTEGWLNRSLLESDNVHPTQAGHDELSKRLVAALADVIAPAEAGAAHPGPSGSGSSGSGPFGSASTSAVAEPTGSATSSAATPTTSTSRTTVTHRSTTPAQQVALFVGDSYTHGAADVNSDHTYAPLTCTRMGWACRMDAVGGTGFVQGKADHRDYASRLPTTRRKYHPDYVFVTGGRNDLFRPEISQAEITTAVRDYLRQVRAAFPSARLVVLAPFWIDASPPESVQWLTSTEQAAASAVGATWIPTDGWLDRSLLEPDNVHPTAAGHDQLSRRLVDALAGVGIEPSVSRR
jgi:lysophospholipase L1-like esterase